jgi:thioredoxin 1
MLTLDANNIEEIIEGIESLILIDFYSKTCAPCKALLPTFEKLAREHTGEFSFAKYHMTNGVNIRKAVEMGIKKMPTVRLYKNCEVVDEVSGKIKLSDITAMMEKYTA